MTFGSGSFGGAPFGGSPIDDGTQTISESLVLSDVLVGDVWTLINERLLLAGDPTPYAHILAAVNESLGLSDSLRLTLQAILTDSLVLTDTLAGDRAALVALLDSLVLSGTVTSIYSALGTIVDSLALAATLRSVQLGDISDAMAFTETLTTNVSWYAAMLDALALADTAQGLASVTVQLADTVQLTDENDAVGSFIEAIREDLDFALTFTLGDTVYTGYAMNAATKALSSYTNYEFNSLATFGSHTLAAGAAGLYRLGGADDAGTPIVWRIRTGLTTMGTQRMKGLDAAYIGYTATGTVMLKCVVVSSSGEKIGYWYTLTPQSANVSRPGRIPTGRGLRSVYWGFEMTNADAGDIELDILELHPIMLEGRLG